MLNFSVERDPSSQVERNGWPMANDDSKLSPFASPLSSLRHPSHPPVPGALPIPFLSDSVSFLKALLSLVFFFLVKFVTHRQFSLGKGLKKRDNKGCIFQVRDFSAVSSLVPGRLNGFVITSGKYANLSSNQLSLPRFVVL